MLMSVVHILPSILRRTFAARLLLQVLACTFKFLHVMRLKYECTLYSFKIFLSQAIISLFYSALESKRSSYDICSASEKYIFIFNSAHLSKKERAIQLFYFLALKNSLITMLFKLKFCIAFFYFIFLLLFPSSFGADARSPSLQFFKKGAPMKCVPAKF